MPGFRKRVAVRSEPLVLFRFMPIRNRKPSGVLSTWQRLCESYSSWAVSVRPFNIVVLEIRVQSIYFGIKSAAYFAAITIQTNVIPKYFTENLSSHSIFTKLRLVRFQVRVGPNTSVHSFLAVIMGRFSRRQDVCFPWFELRRREKRIRWVTRFSA